LGFQRRKREENFAHFFFEWGRQIRAASLRDTRGKEGRRKVSVNLAPQRRGRGVACPPSSLKGGNYGEAAVSVQCQKKGKGGSPSL